MAYAKNRSLVDRQLSEELRASGDYMELIENFQKAFKELQEKDRSDGAI